MTNEELEEYVQQDNLVQNMDKGFLFDRKQTGAKSKEQGLKLIG